MVLNEISNLHKLGIKYLVMDLPHTRIFLQGDPFPDFFWGLGTRLVYGYTKSMGVV